MRMEEIIRQKLTEAFSPVELVVVDDSDSHAGHAGAREGGESHFQVKIVAEAFNGMSRIDKQRAIYATLKNEMRNQIHALALDVKGTY